jgi:arylsulfatase A-like enzyme
MGFQSMELDESGRTLIQGYPDEYRKWFAEHAPKGVTPDDHGVFWNSWHARPWHTHEFLHPSAWTATRAMEFLDTRDPDVPFFLNISFARPHSPYVPPQTYWDMYGDEDIPDPYIGDWSCMHDDPETAADPNAWRGRLPLRQIRRARRGYLGEISFIDAQIGRLLNHLYRFHRQALNNTWFLFTADHGDMQGDHNLWRKTYAYEGSTHIPFIVTPPKSANVNTRTAAGEVVELRDVMPTLLAAAGVDIPETVDGMSLLPALQTEQTDWRDCIHGEHCTCYSTEQEMHYVTDGKKKYVWLPRLDIEQFFDLETDPGECNDLSRMPEKQDELERWRNKLAAELEKRNCGWTNSGRPVCPSENPLVSPFKETRWQGR